MEQALKSKKTRENNSHISEISRNFLEGEFVIGEERETELDKKLQERSYEINAYYVKLYSNVIDNFNTE